MASFRTLRQITEHLLRLLGGSQNAVIELQQRLQQAEASEKKHMEDHQILLSQFERLNVALGKADGRNKDLEKKREELELQSISYREHLDKINANYKLLSAKFQHQKTRITELEQSYANLDQEKRKIFSQLEGLKKQAYDAARPLDLNSQSHERISRQFTTLYAEIANWAREFFRKPLAEVELSRHDKVLPWVRCVSWETLTPEAKGVSFSLSFVVEAVVNCIISQYIITNPFVIFGGYGEYYLKNIGGGISSKNEREFLTWRATTFTAFAELKHTNSALEKDLLQLEEDTINNLTQVLEDVFRTITCDHFNTDSTGIFHNRRIDKARKFIKLALDLTTHLAKEPATLKTLDKRFFDSRKRIFKPGDEQVKGRAGEEDEDDDMTFRIDLVMQPGYVKMGGNELGAEEGSSLWIPAKVDVYHPPKTEKKSKAREVVVTDTSRMGARSSSSTMSYAQAATPRSSSIRK